MIIINSIEELLQRISSGDLGNENIIFKNVSQIVPAEIINLIKQLHLSRDNNTHFKTSMQFSFRQRQCIELLLAGMSNKEIANELNLSVRTIEKYIALIKSRMQAKTRLELALCFTNIIL